jgi:hypothetical protein
VKPRELKICTDRRLCTDLRENFSYNKAENADKPLWFVKDDNAVRRKISRKDV